MMARRGTPIPVTAAVGLLFLAAAASARNPQRPQHPHESAPASRPAAQPKETTMTTQASGTFDVDVTPVPADDTVAGSFPRHALSKRFHGDLEGTSEGVMMSVEAAVEGSGAYVAIERVSATLGGHQGGFSMVHRGTMRRGGDFRIAVDIVPDSGTGELADISGTMDIVIVDREHRYVLHYALPEAP